MEFGVGPSKVTVRTPPRYNVAPMQKAPVVRLQNGLPVVHDLRWGLIPSWAKDSKLATQCINARSETVAEKPTFRSAFQQRRCVIPADGYYEWVAEAKLKLPWRFVLQSGRPMLFAGLWELWTPKERPEVREETFTVLTTASNRDASKIHDRMPVVLREEQALTWLAPDASKDQLLELCKPLPDGSLQAYRVGLVVNSASHETPECVQPMVDYPSTPDFFS